MGTPFGFYFYYYAFMAHITSFLLVSLFCTAWLKGVGTPRKGAEWIVLGLLAGLMIMIRPQNALVLLMLGVEAYFSIAEGSKENRGALWRYYILGGLLTALSALAAFVPQMLFWWKLYGNPVQMPKMEEMNWLSPRIDLTLFSTYHGLLSWSPLLLLTIPGLWILHKKNRIIGSAFTLVVLAQVYINSANEIWWAGGSFSNRRFVDYSFIFVLAFAACWRKWGRSPLFIAFVAVASLWNVLLLCAERLQILTLDHHVPWTREFLQSLITIPLHPIALLRALHGDYAGAPMALRIVLAALILLAGFAAYRFLTRGMPSRKTAAVLLGFVLVLGIWMGVAVARTKPIDLTSPATKAFVATLAKPEYGEVISRRNRVLWNNYYEAGFFYLSQGKLERARDFYTKARNLLPEHPSAYRYLGIIYERLGDLEAARANLEKSLAIRPNYEPARRSLLYVYGQILSRNPINLDVLKRLARLAVEAGQIDTAEAAISQALVLAPDDPEVNRLKRMIERSGEK